MRVLNRLDEMRGVLHTDIPTDKLSEMYEIAEAFEPQTQENEDAVESEQKEESFPKTKRLLSASSTYIQSVNTKEVPYHYQIVVPGATGMASAGAQQIYEVSIWERNLLQIFWEAGVNCTRFEYCSGKEPLVIDVFATPSLDSAELYWKSAFEEMRCDTDNTLIRLKSRSLKQMFPPSTSYVAVIFDDGNGMVKLVGDHSTDPRKIALDVVGGLWQETEEEPPENMDENILGFKEWPR